MATNFSLLHSKCYCKYDFKLGGEREMEIKDYMLDEMKRLNRLNDNLEKKIIKEQAVNNEPEQIVCNIRAMCEIANNIC